MDGGIGEMALLDAAIGGAETGAVVGGGTSLLTGKDPLKGAMYGALGGALTGGVMNGMGGAAGAGGAGAGGTSGVAGDLTSAIPNNIGASNTLAATQNMGNMLGSSNSGLMDIGNSGLTPNPSQGMFGVNPSSGMSMANPDTFSLASSNTGGLGMNPSLGSNLSGPGVDLSNTYGASGFGNSGALGANSAVSSIGNVAPSSGNLFSQLGDQFSGLSTNQKLMLGGGAGLGALMLADRRRYGVPKAPNLSGPLSKFGYDPSTYRPSLPYAQGGIAGLAGGGMPHGQSRSGALRSTLGMLHGVEHLSEFSRGGSLGGYSDGGQMLKGPGDGMSDSIPAHIDGKQPARLADGEFVIPADVVSHLGNGSTDAGAKHLYDMMSKVRKARTGNPKQGKQINASKYLPK